MDDFTAVVGRMLLEIRKKRTLLQPHKSSIYTEESPEITIIIEIIGGSDVMVTGQQTRVKLFPNFTRHHLITHTNHAHDFKITSMISDQNCTTRSSIATLLGHRRSSDISLFS